MRCLRDLVCLVFAHLPSEMTGSPDFPRGVVIVRVTRANPESGRGSEPIPWLDSMSSSPGVLIPDLFAAMPQAEIQEDERRVWFFIDASSLRE